MEKKKELSVVKATRDLLEIKITKDDIKNLFCPLATEKELAIALGIVKSLHLNPFIREVHFIKYKTEEKISIVVGYEVYLKRAERTGKLDGWQADIDQEQGIAWVKIWRKDWKEPFEWSIKLSEFNKKQATWNQIPSFMAKKVAIAQGFRLAFPDELGGMPYTKEETEVYDVSGTIEREHPQISAPQEIRKGIEQSPEGYFGQDKPHGTSTEAQQKAIHTLAAKLYGKKDEGKLYELLGNEYGVESTTELSKEQAGKLIENFSKQLNAK